MPDTDGGLDTSTEGEIERFLDDWMADEEIPGCSVAVFDADGILYATGLGARDLESGAPATPDTLYNVASVTKIVTTVAVLQQVDRAGVALDDAVTEYVPYLEEAPGDPITVRALLSHTSGLPSTSLPARENIASKRDLQLHLDGGADRRVTENPPWMYSNGGFKLLGELVEAVDGRPFPEYVEAEVLDPLGMERSTFDQAVLGEDDDAMTGYEREDGDRVPAEEPLSFETQPADGGLVSSAVELTRLLRCLLHDGTLEGTQVLTPASVEKMTDRQAQPRSTLDGEPRCYGFGLGVDPFLGDEIVGHTGSVGRSQAYVGGLVDRKLGVALAINTAGVPVGDYGRGVLALAAGEDPTEEVRAFELQEKLEAVAGTYEAYRGPTATVEAHGGHVTVHVEGEWQDDRYPAFPSSTSADDYSFYAVTAGLRDPVEFRETDDGMTLLAERYRFDET
jgi:CubicO group peptidase (beta-lactamase class C family)